MAVVRWTEAETKRALYLYFQIPFGQIHSQNPEIIDLAKQFDRTPSSIAMKLANFASLDSKITETGRKGLAGATALDRRIWAEFNQDWTRLILDAEDIGSTDFRPDNIVKDSSVHFSHEPYVGQSVATATVEQRIGQNFFRRAVLANYNERCCVTGMSDPRLLNASHIVPWSVDEKNRHNPTNGLCLSATFDRAFDRGLMSVDIAGRARFSAHLLESSSAETRDFFLAYDQKVLSEGARFDPNPNFLQWHRENLFIGDIKNV